MNPTPWTRRAFLGGVAGLPWGLHASMKARAAGAAEPQNAGGFRVHKWVRDPRNPIFPPRESFDAQRCMNPFVIRRDDAYWLFYGGADARGAPSDLPGDRPHRRPDAAGRGSVPCSRADLPGRSMNSGASCLACIASAIVGTCITPGVGQPGPACNRSVGSGSPSATT